MIDLAENGEEGYIPLRDIAQRQEISKKYLEIIVKDMVSAGLIVGASGKGGGYKLCRKPDQYTVGEILEQIEGNLSSVACLSDSGYECSRRDHCKTLPLWKEFDSIVRDFLYGKKLTDLYQ